MFYYLSTDFYNFRDFYSSHLNLILNFSVYDKCLYINSRSIYILLIINHLVIEDISAMKKKKSIVADEIILRSPFYKGRRMSRKTFEKFDTIITEKEIKEYNAS